MTQSQYVIGRKLNILELGQTPGSLLRSLPQGGCFPPTPPKGNLPPVAHYPEKHEKQVDKIQVK